MSNRGALTERWVVRFLSPGNFEVIGEHVGVIATGNTVTDCAPNTLGAMFPVWVVRTIQQGPESVPDDQFTLLIRGDVDTI